MCLTDCRFSRTLGLKVLFQAYALYSGLTKTGTALPRLSSKRTIL
ncbi:hypothetical protein NEILACOT_04685 [Neisseria lactamica ATCC 23970]|uniref:Uncharacterized protein n=1 Tax=Neisseria lactamica ATCC 23970 TaxID=546265 RepID=D0WAW2_NEILA|nr:hypothetical protein NEILACOT_04897 [Neisseria lactamica ATCC 23970]EEZ75235.1 hypothetical protein NEILACOT_04685 [Neisseria lactamica ATCC 23970]